MVDFLDHSSRAERVEYRGNLYILQLTGGQLVPGIGDMAFYHRTFGRDEIQLPCHRIRLGADVCYKSSCIDQGVGTQYCTVPLESLFICFVTRQDGNFVPHVSMIAEVETCCSFFAC